MLRHLTGLPFVIVMLLVIGGIGLIVHRAFDRNR